MSKAYLQLTQSIKIGDRRVVELAGDFEMIDDNAVAQTLVGELVIPRGNLLCVIMLAEDADMAALGDDVQIVN